MSFRRCQLNLRRPPEACLPSQALSRAGLIPQSADLLGRIIDGVGSGSPIALGDMANIAMSVQHTEVDSLFVLGTQTAIEERDAAQVPALNVREGSIEAHGPTFIATLIGICSTRARIFLIAEICSGGRSLELGDHFFAVPERVGSSTTHGRHAIGIELGIVNALNRTIRVTVGQILRIAVKLMLTVRRAYEDPRAAHVGIDGGAPPFASKTGRGLLVIDLFRRAGREVGVGFTDRQVVVVVINVHDDAEHHLLAVAHAADGAGLGAGLGEGGEKHAGQDRNDRDDNQQFNQSEGFLHGNVGFGLVCFYGWLSPESLFRF